MISGSIGTCNQVSKIYTIQNTGNGPLVCSGINISGSNAAEFTVSGISFPATILAGNSTTFTIRLFHL
ncbi:MAG: choice-of-anchor D domain-containing protein [Bacteroidetes bacterium]|nr:choice-of-anchor D domain-containing protein [Bacteroidota bacterium]